MHNYNLKKKKKKQGEEKGRKEKKEDKEKKKEKTSRGGGGENQTLTAIVGSSNSIMNLWGLGTSGGSHTLKEAWDKKGQGGPI